MIEKLLQFFRVNKQLLQRAEDLERTLSIAEGRILELKEYNKQLVTERDELKNIVFKKFGLLPSAETSLPSDTRPAKRAESWPIVKRALEQSHRQTNEITEAQQAHWDAKLKKDEERAHGTVTD